MRQQCLIVAQGCEVCNGLLEQSLCLGKREGWSQSFYEADGTFHQANVSKPFFLLFVRCKRFKDCSATGCEWRLTTVHDYCVLLLVYKTHTMYTDTEFDFSAFRNLTICNINNLLRYVLAKRSSKKKILDSDHSRNFGKVFTLTSKSVVSQWGRYCNKFVFQSCLVCYQTFSENKSIENKSYLKLHCGGFWKPGFGSVGSVSILVPFMIPSDLKKFKRLWIKCFV